MGFLQRSSFARGWMPDADAVAAPAEALLRADNCILDELGTVSLRPGSAKINSVALAHPDIHTLFTGYLSGTRYRMAGANNAVYANGVEIVNSLAGSGDFAFGSHLGQILFARSTSKKKYDGTTLRNLGIAMTGGALTAAALAPDSDTFATFASGETTWTDNFGVSANAAGYDGTANAAKSITVSTANGTGMISKRFASDQDFSTYTAGLTATDDDILSLYVYIVDPSTLFEVSVMVDVNSASPTVFQDDYYHHTWRFHTQDEADSQYLQRLRDKYDAEGATRDRVEATGFTEMLQGELQPGWNKLTVRRGDLQRFGGTFGKDWSTVRGVRFRAFTVGDSTAAPLRFDQCVITGGSTRNINGKVKYRYILVRNDGVYTAKSAPSVASAEYIFTNAGGDLTIPADASRDSQANEIWVFRMGGSEAFGFLDSYYRVKVQTGVSGTGSVAISDTLSAKDALIANIRLETDNAVPPNNIIGMAGPYYDRMMYLTSDGFVYPSRQLNPDSCSAGQAIRVTGADETPYWIKKAFGGLYIGTSKDVYRLEGTGAELPDDTVDFTLAPMNIDHPPRSEALAQEGDLLLYLASDGWRAMNGSASKSLVGATSLLYKGYTRHGISAVNLATGRFRGAITKGQFVAMTPEGASTTSTPVLYRHIFDHGWWYRHTYGAQAWRCVYREPDGTLIASDSAGFIWTLDTGTQDGSTDIAVVAWTKVDDDSLPLQRKDLWDLRVRADTGNANAAVAVHLDGSGSSATSVTVTQNGMGVTLGALNAVAVCRQVQLRITGSFSTFRLYDFGIQYRARPPLSTFVEPKPELPSLQRRRFGGLQLVADTLGGAATVTPMLDGIAQATLSYTSSDALGSTLTFSSLVGRDLWAKISKTTGFEYYQLQPLILDTLPVKMKGQTPESEAGVPGIKTMSGVQLRVCTLGSAVTVTVIIDGTSYSTTFAVTTGADDPDEVTLAFPAAQEGARIALSFSGDVELYDWKPLVTAVRPLGVKSYDSGPLDLGVHELVWLREVRLKVRATAQLTITPYFDGVPFAAYTTTDLALNVDTIASIPIGRGYKGKIPRVVITSSGAFYPHWVEYIRRTTGAVRDTPSIRVPLPFGGQVAA